MSGRLRGSATRPFTWRSKDHRSAGPGHAGMPALTILERGFPSWQTQQKSFIRKGRDFLWLHGLNLRAMPDYPCSLHIKTIEHSGWLESHATIAGTAGAAEFLQARERLPGGTEAAVMGVDLFGTAEEIAGMEEAVRLAGIAAPVTSVLSTAPCGGGMQFMAATGVNPAPLVLRDRVAGYLIEDSMMMVLISETTSTGGLRSDSR